MWVILAAATHIDKYLCNSCNSRLLFCILEIKCPVSTWASTLELNQQTNKSSFPAAETWKRMRRRKLLLIRGSVTTTRVSKSDNLISEKVGYPSLIFDPISERDIRKISDTWNWHFSVENKSKFPSIFNFCDLKKLSIETFQH